ncbi:MAG: NAD(P)-dependent glycerol-3-phosphate dehydrogenase [Nitrospirae bacterium]|nr:NAD(P)-dependent glycerol-3-phosphate dehydrogenase [Nitrospirota bacterium]
MGYIAVIGAGSWGTTLAYLLSEKGYDISLWVYEESLAEEIKRTRINSIYLPDVSLPDNIKITNHIDEAVARSRYILNVVPSQHTRTIFKDAFSYIPDGTTIINAAKGIEKGSLMTISSVLKEVSNRPVSVLSGPSFAKEVIKKMPTAVTLATEDIKEGLLGISDGLGLGYDARAALITRGLAEIRRLGSAMGAKKETFSGLSGLGDLVLTCTGPLSRNYTVGVKLAQGLKLAEILSRTKTVAEGIATAESSHALSKKYNIEMPIIEQVYNVLYKDKSPADAVNDLMNRSLKAEFYE